MKIPSYQVPLTQPSPKIVEPVSTNSNSTITDINVPIRNYNPSFNEDSLKLIPAIKNSKYGFVDSNQSFVIEPKYDWVEPFVEGLAVVKLNGSYGFINELGIEIIPLKYKRAYSFSENVAGVKFKGKFGYIDKEGNEVIQFKYHDAHPFKNGWAYVRTGYRWFCIDKNGTENYEP